MFLKLLSSIVIVFMSGDPLPDPLLPHAECNRNLRRFGTCGWERVFGSKFGEQASASGFFTKRLEPGLLSGSSGWLFLEAATAAWSSRECVCDRLPRSVLTCSAALFGTSM